MKREAAGSTRSHAQKRDLPHEFGLEFAKDRRSRGIRLQKKLQEQNSRGRRPSPAASTAPRPHTAPLHRASSPRPLHRNPYTTPLHRDLDAVTFEPHLCALGTSHPMTVSRRNARA